MNRISDVTLLMLFQVPYPPAATVVPQTLYPPQYQAASIAANNMNTQWQLTPAGAGSAAVVSTATPVAPIMTQWPPHVAVPSSQVNFYSQSLIPVNEQLQTAAASAPVVDPAVMYAIAQPQTVSSTATDDDAHSSAKRRRYDATNGNLQEFYVAPDSASQGLYVSP